MQTKIQTILFFTFLICVHISLINTLKLRSNKNLQTSQLQLNAEMKDADDTKSSDTRNPLRNLIKNSRRNKHDEKIGEKTDLKNFAPVGTPESDTAKHRDQFALHHDTPRNLTKLNDKVAERLDRAHKRLNEIDDLRKENEERKLFELLPKKVKGITSVGVLNLDLKHISKQTKDFKIASVEGFQKAFNEAVLKKESKVTVDGKGWRIKEIGNNFWYGAIVNGGGIGIYTTKHNGNEYALIITHDVNISLRNFALFFEDLKHKFEHNKDQLKVDYIKEHVKDRTDALKKRLRNDYHLYQEKIKDE